MLPSRGAGLSIFLVFPEPGALGLVGGIGLMAGTNASTAGTRGAVGQRGCNACFCAVMEGSNETPKSLCKYFNKLLLSGGWTPFSFPFFLLIISVPRYRLMTGDASLLPVPSSSQHCLPCPPAARACAVLLADPRGSAPRGFWGVQISRPDPLSRWFAAREEQVKAALQCCS